VLAMAGSHTLQLAGAAPHTGHGKQPPDMA